MDTGHNSQVTFSVAKILTCLKGIAKLLDAGVDFALIRHFG